MNLILFGHADRLDTTRIILNDKRLRYLQQRAASVGDCFKVGEINGLIGAGEILELNQQAAILSVSLTERPPPPQQLTLVVALPRPKMLRRILRTVGESGIRELHLLHSYRVEKSYWQSPVLTDEILRDYLLQGLSQCRDTRLPTVTCHRQFKPFTEDILPGLTGGTRALLAHPGPYSHCPVGASVPTLVVVGPEGGFIPYEVDLLTAAGCTPVSLGPRILRVENAVSGLLGRLNHPG